MLANPLSTPPRGLHGGYPYDYMPQAHTPKETVLMAGADQKITTHVPV